MTAAFIVSNDVASTTLPVALEYWLVVWELDGVQPLDDVVLMMEEDAAKGATMIMEPEMAVDVVEMNG